VNRGRGHDSVLATICKHVYANGLRIAKIVNSSTYYHHQDHLGSTRLVTTSSATDDFSSNYKPFGPQYGASGVEVFKYVGQLHDTVTGLYPFGARFYDPNVGRFITQDPLLGHPRDPQSLNRYAYARNNPLRYVDPHGLAFHPVGSTSAVTAILGQTTANLIGPVVTTGTASVTNVLARVAATTTPRTQLIPTIVTTIPGSTSNADSSQDESSDDPYGNPDYIVGNQIVIDPWGEIFNPSDTFTPEPPAPAFTRFGSALPPLKGMTIVQECDPDRARLDITEGLVHISHGSVEMGTGMYFIQEAGFARGFGAPRLAPAGLGLIGTVAFLTGLTFQVLGAIDLGHGLAGGVRCKWENVF
jgi:RHS repeat-associated protein